MTNELLIELASRETVYQNSGQNLHNLILVFRLVRDAFVTSAICMKVLKDAFERGVEHSIDV